jgi:REP element-mobilizing transposase RayT
VMARGNARQAIFRDDDDRQAFVENLGRVCERYSWRSWAWCLMENLFRLLLETAQVSSDTQFRALRRHPDSRTLRCGLRVSDVVFRGWCRGL